MVNLKSLFEKELTVPNVETIYPIFALSVKKD